jgi:hypothetical protein
VIASVVLFFSVPCVNPTIPCMYLTSLS